MDLNILRAGMITAAMLSIGCGADSAVDGEGRSFGPALVGPALDTTALEWTTLPEVASVSDARRTSSGWFLVDVRVGEAYHLSDHATSVRPVAHQGDGPGELRMPEFAAVVSDTVWILPPAPVRADGFGPDGRFLRQLALGAPPCAPALLHAVAPDPPRVAMAVQCVTPDGTKRFLGWASLSDGVTEWAPWGGPGPRPSQLVGVVDMDRMGLAWGDGRLTSTLSSAHCVGRSDPRPLDEAWTALGGVYSPALGPCLDETDRPPLAPAVITSLRRDLTPMAKRIGLRFEAPTHDGYLDRLFVTDQGLVVSRPDGSVLVIESLDWSDRAWRLRLPEGVTPFLAGGDVLLVRQALEGTTVARLTLQSVLP